MLTYANLSLLISCTSDKSIQPLKSREYKEGVWRREILCNLDRREKSRISRYFEG